MPNNIHCEHPFSDPLVVRRVDRTYEIGLSIANPSFDHLFEHRSSYLHSHELTCFNTLEYTKRQHSYLLGRYCAKMALYSQDKNTIQSDVRISHGVFKQPIVTHPFKQNCQVSIAHSYDWGSALSFPEDHPMGIDIEKIKPRYSQAILSCMTKSETDIVKNSLPCGNEWQTYLWTIKEALSKIIKCGLTTPFEVLEIAKSEEINGILISYYKNFSQYKSVSFETNGNICSIVLPKKSYIDFPTQFEPRLLTNS